MYISTLFILGLGGVLFALFMAIGVWLESGSRRKNLHLLSRIVIWGITVPLALTISILTGLLLGYLFIDGEKIGGAYLTIIKYGTVAMVPMGALGGLLSHFLLKYTS